MQLPSYWKRPSFTIAESAAMIGANEDALRNWLAHSITPYTGQKSGRRIYLAGLDVFYWSLVKQFTGFGVPVRTAMASAMQYANEASDDLPKDEYLSIRTDGFQTTFHLTDKPDFSQATLVIPLRGHALDLVVAAGLIYCADEAAPANPIKIGTAAGRPIAEWVADIEAQVAKMPVNS